MKKFFLNKIVTFFIVIFCVLVLLSVPTLATDNSYTFNDFNGIERTVPTLPDGINNYKHYIMVLSGNDVSIFCFNDKLGIVHSPGLISLNGDDGTTLKLFKSSLGGSSWEEYAEQGNYSILSSSVFITTSDDLLKYGSKLNGDDDFFFQPPTVETTLAPIMEETPLEGVLQEIVGILPVVLVIIAGLIGLRKALAMLSRVLHQS